MHHYRDYQQHQNHKYIITNREQNQPIHQMHGRIHPGHRLQQHAQQCRFGHHATMLESATLSHKYLRIYNYTVKKSGRQTTLTAANEDSDDREEFEQDLTRS